MSRDKRVLFARHLRRRMTEAERVFWEHARRQALGVRVRRQTPILGWIVDFYVPSRRLAIEIDGPIHGSPEKLISDRIRDAALARVGITTLRLTNIQILHHLEPTLALVRARCRN